MKNTTLRTHGIRLPEGCEARCRGCAHRGMSAAGSLSQKERWLKTQLAPWRPSFTPIRSLPEEGRWGYRDKLCLSTAWEAGQWHFGLMCRDRVIPIPRCPLHSWRARRAVGLLADALPPGPEFPMAFYVQSGAQSTLVLKTNRQPGLAWLDNVLRKDLEAAGIEGLWLNLHPCAGRRLFAKRGWHLLWGRPCSRDRHGLTYGPSAFQQLLPRLYDDALDEALSFLAPSGADLTVDLYCGIGSGLRRWAGAGSRAIGVECSREAVECARRNAPHALVLQGRCKDRLPQLEQQENDGASRSGQRLLYANPPRTGIEPEVLKWIADSFRPKRMAYLSCSAGTLRRDLDQLTGAGYRIKRITPYDFFPHTYHVETLVLLDQEGPGPG